GVHGHRPPRRPAGGRDPPGRVARHAAPARLTPPPLPRRRSRRPAPLPAPNPRGHTTHTPRSRPPRPRPTHRPRPGSPLVTLLVLQHQPDTGLGALTRSLEERDLDLRRRDVATDGA